MIPASNFSFRSEMYLLDITLISDSFISSGSLLIGEEDDLNTSFCILSISERLLELCYVSK